MQTLQRSDGLSIAAAGLLLAALGCLAPVAARAAAPPQGVRARVSSADGPVKANVREAATGTLLIGLGVNSSSGLNGSIVINERNFDLSPLPRHLEELMSGRAFRGAGQEFRLDKR